MSHLSPEMIVYIPAAISLVGIVGAFVSLASGWTANTASTAVNLDKN